MDTRAYLNDLYAANQQCLLARVEQAQRDGQLPQDTDASALSVALHTVWHGLSAQSNLGLGRDGLLDVAHLVIAALPEAAVTHGASSTSLAGSEQPRPATTRDTQAQIRVPESFCGSLKNTSR